MVQPAGRARMRIGDTSVTYLPDGYGWINPAMSFPSTAPGEWATHAEFLDARGWFSVSIGSFLIQTAGRAILVDLGLGEVDFAIPETASFTGGRLPAGLASEGLKTDDIDTVVFTHLHHDHVGWTSDVAPAPELPEGAVVGAPTFGAARHLVSETEWSYWADRPGFPGPDRDAVLGPLSERIAFVRDGDEIAPGVRVLATPGHTPGHSSLVVTDPAGADDRRLIILGDVMHCQAQVTQSRWTFRFDVDAEQAIATRRQLLKELEHENTLLAAGHFAGHVFGRVLPPSSRRAWADGRHVLIG